MNGTDIAIAIAIASVDPSASDRSEAAGRVVERAKVHVAAGEYDKASVAFAEAFTLDPNPAYLYARAQVERFGGDCATAVQLYRAFLAEDPPQEDRALAERHIETCGGERVREAAPPEPAPTPVIDSVPKPDPVEPVGGDVRPVRWVADVTGGVLVGTGIVGLAVGLGFYGRALQLDRAADDAATQDAFARDVQRAITFNRVGLVTLGVGSALVVAGVVRYAVVASRGRSRRVARLAPFTVRF
jgi:tetratricopeptide (TPR) repeat protein